MFALFTYILFGIGQYKYLSTTGIVELTEKRIDDGIDLLMTTRLIQDCLEDFFCDKIQEQSLSSHCSTVSSQVMPMGSIKEQAAWGT